MIKPMVKVYIITVMGLNIKDNGKMISNTAKVRKLGLMELSIKGIIRMAKNMGMGN